MHASFTLKGKGEVQPTNSGACKSVEYFEHVVCVHVAMFACCCVQAFDVVQVVGSDVRAWIDSYARC